MAVSLIFSLATMRLNKEEFVVGTLAFQMILFDVLNNWTDLTRGPLGIRAIPYPRVLGWNIRSSWDFLALGICLL